MSSYKYINGTDLFNANLFDLPNDHESFEIRKQTIERLSNTIDNDKESLKKQQNLSLFEEILCIIILLIFPGTVFLIPFLSFISLILIYFNYQSGYYILSILIFSFLIPNTVTSKYFSNKLMKSKLSYLLLKYFSFKIVYKDYPTYRSDHAPSKILACPPHGTFPIGNILSLICMKNGTGRIVYGLAATAVFYLPIFKNIMSALYCIDASKENALDHIKNKHSDLGISPGGVRGIFEKQDHQETIFIKQRYGFVKLALQTGSIIQPCYILGNTQTFKHFYDKYSILATISRKLKAGICLLYGRFYLPIMFRIPLTAVMGKEIQCPKISIQL